MKSSKLFNPKKFLYDFWRKKIFEMRKKNRWRSVRIPNPPGYGCLFSWRLRIWKPFGNILSQKSFGIIWFEVIWRLECAILMVDCRFSTNGFICKSCFDWFEKKFDCMAIKSMIGFQPRITLIIAFVAWTILSKVPWRNIFCKLKKTQKTWISFFAGLKNLKKHEFHFLQA